jgi:hypothetical protein
MAAFSLDGMFLSDRGESTASTSPDKGVIDVGATIQVMSQWR